MKIIAYISGQPKVKFHKGKDLGPPARWLKDGTGFTLNQYPEGRYPWTNGVPRKQDQKEER